MRESWSGSLFRKLLAIGIFGQLFIQTVINIGMNLGLVPITGITLPLVSFGGSSIVATCIGLGFIDSFKRVGKAPIAIK